VPRRTYFVQPDYQSVRISPDGKHLAYLAPVNGVRNLFVAPIADPRGGRQITRVDRDIGVLRGLIRTGTSFFQNATVTRIGAPPASTSRRAPSSRYT
jgi:hypothetical protein